MTSIREVYSGLDQLKADYSVADQMAQGIIDAVIGPTRYSGVRMLNHASDYCSQRGFGLALSEPQFAAHMLEASLILADLADQLDEELAGAQ